MQVPPCEIGTATPVRRPASREWGVAIGDRASSFSTIEPCSTNARPVRPSPGFSSGRMIGSYRPWARTQRSTSRSGS